MKSSRYQELAEQLEELISEGKWQQNDKLPSIRQLCRIHSLSKITVQNALHMLESKGLVYAKQGSGYFVSEAIKADTKTSEPLLVNRPRLVDMPSLFLEIMAYSAAFDIVPSTEEIEVNSLALLNRHIARSLRQDSSTKAYYYDAPEGNEELRGQIREHYRQIGLGVSADDICVTSGCQNSLFLALSASCKPGDIVAVESPAFYGLLQLLQQLQLKVVEIASSNRFGLCPNELEQHAKRWDIKACIVTPSYATPTGSCMTNEQKQKIVDISHQYQFTLIEDDIYGDLGFQSRPKPLKAFDKEGNVILCSSVSKSLSRDLRLGWIMGGKHHAAISHLKLINQLSTSQSLQIGLASFMAEGHYRRHLFGFRQQLAARLEHLIGVLANHWKFPYQLTNPEGGLALWVQFEGHVDTLSLYHQLKQQNIIITPGVLFFC